MFQMTLNSHAKFHGDRTIGGAITVKEAFKNTIFQLYINVNCKKTFIFSHIHKIFTSYDRTPQSEQLCLWEYFHQSKCYLNILNYVQNLLLRTSPRFFPQSEPNYCRNVLWKVNINNYQKKVEISTHVRKGVYKRSKEAGPILLK